MKTVNLESTRSIEDYLFHLAVFSISLNNLGKLQTLAYNKGILQDDEVENANTIGYEIDRLFTVINDQVNLILKRTPKEWDEILEEVKNSLNIEKQSSDEIKSKEKG